VCVCVCLSATKKVASAFPSLSSLISCVGSFTHTHTHTRTHTHIHARMRAYTERQTDERTHAHTAQDCWQPQRRPLLQSVGFAWNCVTYHIRGVGLRSIPCRCYLFSCSHTSFFPASPYRPPAEASVTVELQLPSGRKSHAAYGALDLRHGARGPVTQGMPCVKHVSLFFSPSLAACSLALQACINAMRCVEVS